MKRSRSGIVILAVLLVAASCGRGDDDSDPAAPTTSAPATTVSSEPDPCEGPLEATEIGVTEDEIVIEVMADTGSPLAPGLFQGAIDSVVAWAREVNDRGGLACRKVVVRTWDSKLSPEDTTNGTIDACANAVAMVGSNALFLLDPTALATCRDAAGNATGLPDIAVGAGEIPHQCNPTTFAISAVPGACPYEGGARLSTEFIGPWQYYKELEPDLHGIFLVPGDLPSAIHSSILGIRAAELSGTVVNNGEFRVSGRDEQPAYVRFLQTVKERGSTFAYNGSNDLAMVKLRKEAVSQGVDSVKIWACSLACYTPAFIEQGGAQVEGTYLWIPFVPLEEADAVPALREYVDAIGGLDKTTSWGVGAWAGAIAFETVVDDIVEADGPNGITRQKILDGLHALKESGTFSANGIYGERLNLGGPFSCFVVLQVKDGSFVRVHPEEPGTLDCAEDNQFRVELDPTTEFRG